MVDFQLSQRYLGHKTSFSSAPTVTVVGNFENHRAAKAASMSVEIQFVFWKGLVHPKLPPPRANNFFSHFLHSLEKVVQILLSVHNIFYF